VAAAVFDASAVVALLRNEVGAPVIAPYCREGILSTVNLQESIKILRAAGFSKASVSYMIDALGLEIVPHTEEDAYAAAELVSLTSQYGSGLSDRTCLALAISRKLPALTTDKAWAQLSISGLQIILAR
jgi:ribonuclease VapC